MPPPAKIKKVENVFEELIKAMKAPVEFDLPSALKEWKLGYYIPIKRNVYLTKKRIEDDGIFCSCTPSSGSTVACDKDCQCGMLFSCCSSNCKCDNKCANKSFQHRPLKKTKLITTEKCGFGLVAEDEIKKGEFVIEYVGEVIDDRTCEERLWKMKRQRDTNFYLCEVSSNMVIDATNKGNMSRFINHSCEPNTEMQKWTVDGETRVGIFALCDIKDGEELTYDYKFVQFGADQDCHCGSSNCRKMLGTTKPVNSIVLHNGNSGSSQDQHVVKKRKTTSDNCIGEIIRLWHRRDKMYVPAVIYGFNEYTKIHTLMFDVDITEEFDLREEDWDFLPRFYFIRSAFKQMVICDMWDTYKDDSVGTAQFVKEKILNDVWWGNVKHLIEFTEPIYSMLREVDTDKSCLHLIYEMWDSMIEKVKDAIYKWEGKEPHEDCFFYSVIHSILVDRWGKSNTPLHCLAHSLNPRYYAEAWIQGGPNRQFPHDDNEINKNVLKCLKKFFPITEQYRKLKAQFADFSQFGEGFDSFEDRAHLKPKQWWSTHGGSAPELRALALKLLGQPSSSSCCERNWSTYGFIHSMKRNKMTPEHAEDLVFVHTNLRLLSRKSEKYHHGPTRMWDVGADAHESFTSGVGILEIANLSLDEPELEMELCEDATRDDDAETTMDES